LDFGIQTSDWWQEYINPAAKIPDIPLDISGIKTMFTEVSPPSL
jgi:hypothetical protein